MPSAEDVLDRLAAAARDMNAAHTLEEALDSIVEAARISVPGFDEVGISVVEPKGKIETKAGTGQLVWDLDNLQYELGEGPCMDALRTEPVVIVENLRHKTPWWPHYVPEATRAGVRAQMGLRLYVEDQTIGGLNLYSRSQDTIEPDAAHLAAVFATHAALALGKARLESQLTEAMETRTTIGMAVGLVMGRYELTEQQAFAFLARASTQSNIKLRDIANEIVWAADAKHGRRAPSD